MAVKFAHAFGCRVTAFSTSPDKEAASKSLGADDFVLSSNPDQMAAAANSQDFILATPHTDLNWVDCIKALRPKGTLCVVGAPAVSLLNVPPVLLLLQEKKICGSNTGGRSTIREMLAFAAHHRIGATVELMPMSQVNAALDKVRSNRARYRMVLKA